MLRPIHTDDAFFMFKTRGAFSPSISKVFTQQQLWEPGKYVRAAELRMTLQRKSHPQKTLL